MNVTEETKEHAQHILNYITMFPERHEQSTWVEVPIGIYRDDLTEDNFCGTTMCIAGTSVFLTEGVEGLRRPTSDFEDIAAERLGLSSVEAHDLFYNTDNDTAKVMLKAIVDGDEDAFWNGYED